MPTEMIGLDGVEVSKYYLQEYKNIKEAVSL
jgi:hypothetical protein